MSVGAMIGTFPRTTVAVDLARYSDDFPMSATQYIRSDGGRFVTYNTGTSSYDLTTATSTQIDGWVEECYTIYGGSDGSSNPTIATPITTSATAKATVLKGTKDIYGVNKVFWLPCYGTLTAAYVGQLCDIYIAGSTTTTKQQVNFAASTYKVLKIVDVDVLNNLALVTAVQKSA